MRRVKGEKGDKEGRVVEEISLSADPHTTIAFHKGLDLACSQVGEENCPSLHSLLPADLPKSLQISGRLDASSTGLVLLTTDGELSHMLQSPIYRAERSYKVAVDRAIDRPDLVKDEFRRGVRLFSEDSVSLPAEFEHLGGREALVTLKEGKYHQVRRMMAAMGYRVMELHRLSHAGIRVDGIEVNRFRVLALDEVDQLRERLKASKVKRGRKEGQETKEPT